MTLSRPCARRLARRLARARPHPAVFPRVHPKLHGRFRLEPDFRGTRVSREGGNTARFLFSWLPRWLYMVYRMEPPNPFSRFRTDSRKHFVGRGVTGPLVWFDCHGCTQSCTETLPPWAARLLCLKCKASKPKRHASEQGSPRRLDPPPPVGALDHQNTNGGSRPWNKNTAVIDRFVNTQHTKHTHSEHTHKHTHTP